MKNITIYKNMCMHRRHIRYSCDILEVLTFTVAVLAHGLDCIDVGVTQDGVFGLSGYMLCSARIAKQIKWMEVYHDKRKRRN